MVEDQWNCPAIDHGVSIFPDQKIRPCCQAATEYSKPLSFIQRADRFSDLKSSVRPDACRKCWENEDLGLPSYRQWFLSQQVNKEPGIKFLDFRHSNQCNLKCRYCGPHFSNQWAKELSRDIVLIKSDISQNLDQLLTDDLIDIYWCGGEPLMMKDHHDVLVKLVDSGISEQVSLRYNTNLTLLNYKNCDIVSLWKQFKKISVAISIDAVGDTLDHIRSGSKWEVIRSNIESLIDMRKTHANIDLNFAPTVTMLNVWFLPELFDYAIDKNIEVRLNVLTGPDYLSLDAIHPKLQHLAKEKIERIRACIPEVQYRFIMSMMVREDNEYLFLHAIRHILLLDNIRKENLFDLLPYKDLAMALTAKNYEYE